MGIEETGYEFGEQPIAGVVAKHGLKAHDLVAASTEQITHKMIARACKGRKLSRHVQFKIVRALNAATGQEYGLKELFSY